MSAPRVSDVGLIIGAAAVAVVGLYLLGRKIAPALNPLSPDNAAYSGVNAVGAALVTDPDGPGKNADGSWSFGGFLHDVFNPDTAQAVREVTQPVPLQKKNVSEPEIWAPTDYSVNSNWGA